MTNTSWKKLGEADGPKCTSTSADHVKLWSNRQHWDPSIDFPMDDGDEVVVSPSIDDDA